MRTGLTPAEALRAILDATQVLPSERVSLREAQGRVLAEAVASRFDLPPADNSAMDGYALRIADIASAKPSAPVALEVVFEVPAGGEAPRALRPGEAARIFTGAPIPPGADAVLRQEDTAREGSRVLCQVPVEARQNIRDAGEDVRRGEVVLEPGATIGAAEIGMLASLGRSFALVHQRPRVAVLSGGDELVEPDGEIAGGRIVSSNSHSIAAQCRELGAEALYLGIARDTPEELERLFRAGLSADVIVSSAGVSVGDRDYVRGVLEKLGASFSFWGVEMKPGYPLAFARFAREWPGLVFGLPGNPVSAMMTFEQFVRPALRKLAGHRSLFRPLIEARVGEKLRKQPGRLHFVRVRLSREGADAVATPTGNQSSGVLRSMVLAQGILIFPAEASELAVGARARVQVLDGDFLAAAEPGF
jgi:molybdopterin molybdotransferase